MNETLLFLHFAGLMLGAAGGMSSGILMRRAMSMPEGDAKIVRDLGPLLLNVSLMGLALLWATGLVMVWSKWDGPQNLPQPFWMKAAFVATLTVFSIASHVSYGALKRGDAAAAARLRIFGPLSGFSALLAVLFAVLAFN